MTCLELAAGVLLALFVVVLVFGQQRPVTAEDLADAAENRDMGTTVRLDKDTGEVVIEWPEGRETRLWPWEARELTSSIRVIEAIKRAARPKEEPRE